MKAEFWVTLRVLQLSPLRDLQRLRSATSGLAAQKAFLRVYSRYSGLLVNRPTDK